MGKWAASEVAQVYLTFPSAAEEPPKLLKGFQKVHIPVGGEAVVSIAITEKELEYWDTVQGKWVVAPGTYNVLVGASSRDIRLKGLINIS